jgi:hypothetical protein
MPSPPPYTAGTFHTGFYDLVMGKDSQTNMVLEGVRRDPQTLKLGAKALFEDAYNPNVLCFPCRPSLCLQFLVWGNSRC